MSRTDITELRAQRAAAIRRMREILDAADAESRDLTAEEMQEYDRLESDVESLGQRVRREEEQRERERELAERELLGSARRPLVAGASDGVESRQDEYERVFRRYLRLGIAELDREERAILRSQYVETRDQAKGTGSAGGFTVPTGFQARLVEHLIQAGAMRRIGTTQIVTAAGEDLQVPKTTAHGAASWVAEAGAITGTDETFGQVTLKAYKAVRLVKVSEELVEDSAVDLEGFLARALGLAIGTLENTAYVNGSGTGQPTGVVGQSSQGKVGATGQTTSVTADDLIDLFYSVGPQYRRSAAWLMADSTVKAVRKLKDANNQYLWQVGLAFGEPDTLLGKPVFDDPDMPAMAASAKSILFGDFSAYWIRDVGQPGPASSESSVQVGSFAVRRLEERYADNLQIGFLAFHRTDGNLIDTTGAIKHYANSAT